MLTIDTRMAKDRLDKKIIRWLLCEISKSEAVLEYDKLSHTTANTPHEDLYNGFPMNVGPKRTMGKSVAEYGYK